MLKGLLRRLKPGQKPLDYEQAKEMLGSRSVSERTALAAREDAAAEMLYYLACDAASEVRREVAANASTPVQADLILATDGDCEVRLELARKISRLIPGLTSEDKGKVLSQTVAVLEKLADDNLARVRQIVAEEIKNSADVPYGLVRKLAQDMETIVCVPVLEYSPLLTDDDLIEIIASGAVSEALCAISRRQNVSGDVSRAIVSTLDIPAVASLLVNQNAQIREETLDEIVTNAERIESWHEPLVMRPDLSTRAARRIACFVASSLLTTLSERNDLDHDLTRELKQRVRNRIEQESDIQETDSKKIDNALEAVKHAHGKGDLNDAFIVQLADSHMHEAVFAGLGLLTGYPVSVVKSVFKSRHGKAIAALTWKAGLTMRTAIALQIKVGHVPNANVLLARNGTDYPMSETEMIWQLDYFAKNSA